MPIPTRTGADLFVETLADYGVTRVFGNPGTTEVPLLQAIGDHELDYTLALHEDVAVGMAAGYASRRRFHAHHDDTVCPLGVVNLHLAPGLAHGLGNLDGADWAGSPVLVTAGAHSTDFQHEEPILSGDTARMAEKHCKWSAEVPDVEALPTMLRRAVRIALTPPTGPVFLALPVDVQLAETDAEPERLGSVPDAGRGSFAAIEAAAKTIADADDPVLVLGQGVAHSAGGVDAAVELAEASGAAVHGETLTAEMPFPASHEQWCGPTPTDTAGYAAVHDADTVVFCGVSRTHTTSIRHSAELIAEDTTCVYLGDDADELGKNYPADVSVFGDPASVASELAVQVEERVNEDERARRLEAVEDRKEGSSDDGDAGDEGDESESDDLLSKNELVSAIYEAAPDARIVNEGVTATVALFESFPMAPEQLTGLKSGGLGYGLPGTVGAAIAEDEADSGAHVIGLIGDGSYLYYPQTLYSAARYDVDLTVVIPDNRNYRILKDNTMRLLGGDEADHEFVGMDFEPPVDFVASATAHGATGERVESPDDIDAVLERALAHDGPFVVDAPVHD